MCVRRRRPMQPISSVWLAVIFDWLAGLLRKIILIQRRRCVLPPINVTWLVTHGQFDDVSSVHNLSLAGWHQASIRHSRNQCMPTMRPARRHDDSVHVTRRGRGGLRRRLVLYATAVRHYSDITVNDKSHLRRPLAQLSWHCDELFHSLDDKIKMLAWRYAWLQYHSDNEWTSVMADGL